MVSEIPAIEFHDVRAEKSHDQNCKDGDSGIQQQVEVENLPELPLIAALHAGKDGQYYLIDGRGDEKNQVLPLIGRLKDG